MSNKVEEIMKNYRKGIKDIDKKYEVKEVKEPKKIDTSEIDSKVKYEQDFIARLKSESEENNKDLIEKAQERLKIAEEEKSRIEQENQKAEEKYQRALVKREEKLAEVAKMKHSMVRHVIREADGEHEEVFREVTMAEKDEMDKNALKNDTIRKLTSENANISAQLESKEKELETKRNELQKQNEEQLKKKEEELKNKRKDLFNFKYKFDENHKITNKAEHQSLSKECKNLEKEIAKLKIADFSKELNPIEKEIKELTAMKEKCNEYLSELKETNKEFESFSKAWNEAKRDESANEQPRTTSKKASNTNSLTARDIMEDILRIQQTMDPNEFDKFAKSLDKKYENVSDTWKNRILNALEHQKKKIEENLNRKPEQENEEKTEAQRLANALSSLNKKRKEEISEQPRKKDEVEHDDFFDIMSIFNDKKEGATRDDNLTIDIPLDNDDTRTGHRKSGILHQQIEDVEVDDEKNGNNSSEALTISRIEIEESTGNVKAYDQNGTVIYNKQFEYNMDTGKFYYADGYDFDADDSKIEELDEKTKKIYDSLVREYRDENIAQEILFENVDKRILYLLVDIGDINLIDDYVWSIAEKDETIPFQATYNLKDIYDTDLSLIEIKEIQRFSKIAQKQNKEMVDVEKDSLPKRIFGRMKKGIQEIRDRKLLTSGENSEKRPSLRKRISKKIEEIANKREDRRTSKTKGREDAEKKHDTYEKLDFSGREALDIDDDFIIGLRDKDGNPLHIDHEKAAHNSENADDFVVAPKNEKSYEDSENDFDDYKF